jgi:putative radical SAM enzyme (TIGR03279 family)
LVDQRLSPLYVSVHATEPHVRIQLLKNPEAGHIMDRLRFLTDHGLEVHTQVVLCPGWNTGPHLDRTVDDLLSLGEGVRTLSVVPVGLTKYNLGKPVRLLTRDEAREAIRQVERGRRRALDERGYGWCYAADEIYLLAGEELPDLSYYDDVELTENGVGAVRRFTDAFEQGIGALPRLAGRRIRLLTGLSMSPFLDALGPRVAEATGAQVEVRAVRNRLFGDSVTVAGLLPGKDLLHAVPDPCEGDVILIPSEALNHDELFIDSFSLEEFRRELAPATVVHGHEITAALRAL